MMALRSASSLSSSPLLLATARRILQRSSSSTTTIFSARPLSTQPWKVARQNRSGSRRAANTASKTPSHVTLTCSEMSNDQLVILSMMDNQKAIAEVLKRHIMIADSVSLQEAQKKFNEIESANRKGLFQHTVPYKITIATAIAGSVASFPLTFHYPTVAWFNEKYVTADVPEPKDLETWMEVGSWAWNWMEPIMGQVSFVLLCMQLARSQIQNIGMKPYTHWIKNVRAEKLARQFPKYNKEILKKYSKSVDYYS